jgi:hypothetical protein
MTRESQIFDLRQPDKKPTVRKALTVATRADRALSYWTPPPKQTDAP